VFIFFFGAREAACKVAAEGKKRSDDGDGHESLQSGASALHTIAYTSAYVSKGECGHMLQR
jgi:hypothetical protein